MLFPAMVAASNDLKLRGAPLDVYLWLVCHRLDFHEYRPVKLTALAISRQLRRNTASRALQILIDRGYIERIYVHRDGHQYRLCITKKEPPGPLHPLDNSTSSPN